MNMKPLSESKALAKLKAIRAEFRDQIRENYEHRAKSCVTCETPGACCLDEHFVNVRITRLEAVAVEGRLDKLAPEQKERVFSRINETISRYKLEGCSAPELKTYACPLFEKGIGCLVHHTAKPLPCIAHACYERKEDLPSDDLLAERETEIDKLNRRVYGKVTSLPIPLAVRNAEAHTK
jgi:hypothetical protein